MFGEDTHHTHHFTYFPLKNNSNDSQDSSGRKKSVPNVSVVIASAISIAKLLYPYSFV